MIAPMQVVIVGAGPAGVRAAQTLVRHGLRPTVLDESGRWGGQIYRQPPPNFERSKKTLYGFDAGRAESIHSTMNGLLAHLDYQPDTLVWNAEGGQLDVLREGQTSTVAYTHLILATGATDRVLPLPGWTTPGVFTLGGTQVALKFQGCSIGQRVVLMGTGPLLYLIAYQYAKAGAVVVGVLDTAVLTDQIVALPAMLQQPGVLAKGLYYVGWLRAHGVPLHSGVQPVRVLGDSRVSGVVWRDGRGEQTVACDAIGIGYGLRSETQLADILGCRFYFDDMQRGWLPERDDVGRASVSGVYLAGDGAGTLGADAAEWAGERAALALVADAQGSFESADTARAFMIDAKLARSRRFRVGLERAFPFPVHWAAQAPDELVICRCEEITAGDLRRTAQAMGAVEMNRLKALSRVGMGRCQGRMCGVAAAEILAQCTGQPVRMVGRLRGQAPVKPIPFTVSEPPVPGACS